MKRRHFLSQTGIVIAAALTKCQGNTNLQQNKSLGVTLLGLGSYSNGQLAPALQSTKYCELRGIITGSPHKIPAWKKSYKIKDENVYSYDTMHQIAENKDIDIVYVVTPPALHAKFSIAAADAGKHVWCEKPMAMNTKECQAIIDACNQNGVKLSIGYRMQHEPNTQTIIKYRETKPFGEITSVKAQAGYQGGGGTGWRHQKAMGGGALYDMGVYTINGIRCAVGSEPIAVENARHIIDRPQLFKEVDETTEYELVFANGLRAYGETSVGRNFNELRVECSKGWYLLNPMQSYDGVKGHCSDGTKLNQTVDDQQRNQMDDNALAIIEQREVLVPGEEGMKDIHIVNAIFESARTGKRVDL